MIISATVSSPVVTNIPSLPSRFKIKASAKAFKILSGFYSEPILAIPRELGANAWDSHVKAGKTARPFVVHAPNQLEPWFSVRDFGTGLSPEDIDQIYTTYFESTKTHENDSDGCMGLGSKTPFNYTENFNVTSWFNGHKHVYNCFIDEAGSPNIMHVVTEESDEENGLEVKFGVKLTDISMWIDRITRAYAPFRHRPTIVGANITYPAREYLYTGKGWGFRKDEDSYGSRGTNAFMGNYCYPVSATALRSTLNNLPTDSYELQQAFDYGHFDFFFDIGELEVAPNKEQLQYEDSNPTAKTIIARMQVAMDELKQLALKKVHQPKTMWEAMALFQKHNSHSGEFYHLRNVIGEIPIYFNTVKVDSGSTSISSVHQSLNLLSASTSLPHYQVNVLESLHGKIRKVGYYTTTANRPVLFFYTNGETIKKARLRHYLATKYSNQIPYCYIITDASPKAKTFHAHQKYLGLDSSIVIEIESLPKPPPAARIRQTTSTDEIFCTKVSESYNPTRRKEAYVTWTKKGELIDSNKTYYYMEFVYNDPHYKGNMVDGDFVNNVVRVFAENKLNHGVDEIFGINVKNRRLLKVGKWINVIELVSKYVEKHRARFEQIRHLDNWASSMRELEDVREVLFRGKVADKLDNSATSKLVSDFIKQYDDVCRNNREYDEEFYKGFNITAKRHQPEPFDVDGFKKLLKEKYLNVVELGDRYNNCGQTIANIMNFIDKNS